MIHLPQHVSNSNSKLSSQRAQASAETTLEPLALISPQPPRLSRHLLELQEIEESGIYSNYGPVNTTLEKNLIEQIFLEGSCVTVCNATIGLMLAIREVTGDNRPADRRYALMPSFTFAATAHAALWCGLTPLFCDIDPNTWMPDPESEQALLREYAGQIAVVVPYATFGNNLDLARYERISRQHGVPIVVDAAASLGSVDERGCAFGAGFHWPVVFSMHATKTFAVGEGGVIYCADTDRLARLRSMGNFGFSEDRSAHSIGLNSKMSEVAAFTANLQLQQYEEVLLHREELAARYLARLGSSFTLQQQIGMRQVRSFQSVLLPEDLAGARSRVIEMLSAEGIGAGSYFSPHLAEQPYFNKTARFGPLSATANVASRILSLPLRSGMTCDQIDRIVGALRHITDHLNSESRLYAHRGVTSHATDFTHAQNIRAA